MYTDPILEEKWKTQKKLAKKANYKIAELVKNAHKDVLTLTKRLNITLKFSNIKGGYTKPK